MLAWTGDRHVGMEARQAQGMEPNGVLNTYPNARLYGMGHTRMPSGMEWGIEYVP